MFKRGSVADEVSSIMEKELISRQAEQVHGLTKVAKAIELLGDAASLFAKAGMLEEEKEIVDVLGSLLHKMEQK